MNLERLSTNHTHPKRELAIACIILHSSGNTDGDAVSRYYQNSSQGVCPHFLVLCDGQIRQFVDIDHTAYHTGLSKEWEERYRAGIENWTRIAPSGETLTEPYGGYGEWIARWPEKNSPLALPCGGHPNGQSIGIEFLATAGELTDQQYQAGSELILTMAEDARLELRKETLLGHFDATPHSRCNKYGGTDPGPSFNWERLWQLLR